MQGWMRGKYRGHLKFTKAYFVCENGELKWWTSDKKRDEDLVCTIPLHLQPFVCLPQKRSLFLMSLSEVTMSGFPKATGLNGKYQTKLYDTSERRILLTKAHKTEAKYL